MYFFWIDLEFRVFNTRSMRINLVAFDSYRLGWLYIRTTDINFEWIQWINRNSHQHIQMIPSDFRICFPLRVQKQRTPSFAPEWTDHISNVEFIRKHHRKFRTFEYKNYRILWLQHRHRYHLKFSTWCWLSAVRENVHRLVIFIT